MSVIPFPNGRSSAPDVEGLLTCHACGSTAFELLEATADGNEHGTVVLAPDGRVTGYTGTPHCVDCGAETLPDVGAHF